MQVPKVTRVFLCALIWCATVLVMPPHTTAQVVNIPDANLRAAIEGHLGKEEGAQITREEMATLHRFRADGRKIGSLTGLEFAVNLERLELRRNLITDIAPLAGLVALDNIKLRDNQISDITPLAQLVNVEWLGLEENQITDLTPIASIGKLDAVGVSGNPVSDLAPISGMNHLRRLVLNDCAISDISPLADLIGLEELQLDDNTISDITPLAGLTGLGHLDLRENSLSDITPLAGLNRLWHLGLEGNVISDITPLANLTNLHGLGLSNNVISDISPLATLKELRGVWISENVGFDSAPLAGLTRLETFHSWGTPIYSLNGFTDLPRIRVINICGGGISALGPLAGLTGLKELYLVDNDIRDISPLASLTGLTHLSLKHNEVSDVSPLASLTNLQSVDLGDNAITDFSPLSAFPRHVTIIRYDNPGATRATPKDIAGPWLWVVAPTGSMLAPAAASSGIDFLSQMSDGAVTESQIAAEGAIAGEPVGDKVWTAGKLASRGGNNINDVVNAAGLGRDNVDFHVAYGSVTLDAPRTQQTRLFVGSDGAVKVWLNGQLVHNNPVERLAEGYQEEFAVTLRQGTNVLLVAVYEDRGWWSGFFGFEGGTDWTVLPPPSKPIIVQDPPLLADVNSDGQVSILDLILVARELGNKKLVNPRTDVNGDGKVSESDLGLVAESIDALAGAAAPSSVTPAVLEAWIAQAQSAHDGSAAFHQGIVNLQRLLARLRPAQTALLLNYPNPFNPETWIPYHLSEPAQVTLQLYTVDGTLVRTLALGDRAAGRYEARHRAAYWDGKNEHGEPVASGIYFYTLTAGDFTATRKMLIRK